MSLGKLRCGQSLTVKAQKNRGPYYGPETRWAQPKDPDTAASVVTKLEQADVHMKELILAVSDLKDAAPKLFDDLRGLVDQLSDTIKEAQDEFSQYTVNAQSLTMDVHPLKSRKLQKKNKKLQDRAWPKSDKPVDPKKKVKKTKKQRMPKTEIKVKKQPEYKPW